MKPLHLIALVFVLLVGRSQADDSMGSERVKDALRDMGRTSTWYHDDLTGEYLGFKYYAQKRYAEALRYFELGAYYADKPSQISIGLMYLNGEGVEANAVTASAWFDLAAERGYPAYVATRDRIRATLTPDQIAKAAELRKQLAMKYADAVAKPRLAAELMAGLRRQTGSRAGFDTGVGILPLEAIDSHHRGPPGPLDLRAPCAGGFWDQECWRPELYFAMRDKQLGGTVEVGTVQEQR